MKKCKFCAEQIQDDAIKCRHCGSILSDNSSVQTIQQTSKKLKKQIIYSIVLLIASFVIIFFSMSALYPTGVTIGFMIFLAGLIWLCVTKYKIWWEHK